MTRKQVGKNTGKSGRINLSGPELEKFGADIGESIKIDVAESKDIAHAIIDNCDSDTFVIVSNPDKSGSKS
ncbi:MAG: hypothetical protein V5A27_00190 [Halapricum sp.]